MLRTLKFIFMEEYLWLRITHYKKKTFPGYTLAPDTLEALDVKHGYLDGKITEEEYKAYCLKENLIHNE